MIIDVSTLIRFVFSKPFVFILLLLLMLLPFVFTFHLQAINTHTHTQHKILYSSVLKYWLSCFVTIFFFPWLLHLDVLITLYNTSGFNGRWTCCVLILFCLMILCFLAVISRMSVGVFFSNFIGLDSSSTTSSSLSMISTLLASFTQSTIQNNKT